MVVRARAGVSGIQRPHESCPPWGTASLLSCDKHNNLAWASEDSTMHARALCASRERRAFVLDCSASPSALTARVRT